MDTFTASNGITVYVRDGGTVQFQHGTREASNGLLQIYPHSEWWETLRQFFRAEEDERLGRWRWPDIEGHMTVTPKENDARCVLVSDERTGIVASYYRDDMPLYSVFPQQAGAASAYFRAHPEPKPWHEAKNGEIWLLTVGPNTNAYVFEHDYFDRAGSGGTKGLPRVSAGVTAGRRIWPERSDE